MSSFLHHLALTSVLPAVPMVVIAAPEDGALHVSLTGDDDTASGTFESPFRTMAAALRAAERRPMGALIKILLHPGDHSADGCDFGNRDVIVESLEKENRSSIWTTSDLQRTKVRSKRMRRQFGANPSSVYCDCSYTGSTCYCGYARSVCGHQRPDGHSEFCATVLGNERWVVGEAR